MNDRGAVISPGEEPLMVMEYMDHGSLFDILHNNTMVFEGETLLNILRDVSQGMRFLHASNPAVIHADLKAANILVDKNFRAKVSHHVLSDRDTNTLLSKAHPYTNIGRCLILDCPASQKTERQRARR